MKAAREDTAQNDILGSHPMSRDLTNQAKVTSEAMFQIAKLQFWTPQPVRPNALWRRICVQSMLARTKAFILQDWRKFFIQA